MQGGNRGGLGQDSTYSEINHFVMLVLFPISPGMKKQRCCFSQNW
jgi:hypothetical protein